MTDKIYFRTQSLDNISQDPVEEASKDALPVTEENKRREVYSLISNVTEKDHKVKCKSNNLTIYKLNNEIVLDIQSSDIDPAGRKSLISCYANNIYGLKKQDWRSIVEKFRKFAKQNSRNINEDTLKDFEDCFSIISVLKKERIMFRVSLMIFSLILLAFILRSILTSK